MTVEVMDGVRTLRLKDARPTGAWHLAEDGVTLLHIWRLLSREHQMHDAAGFCRQIL